MDLQQDSKIVGPYRAVSATINCATREVILMTFRFGKAVRAVVLPVIAFSLNAAHSALAQTAWPSRPLTLVVTVAAGGSIDTVARLVVDEMSRSLGQSVRVDNRTGAAGSIAASFVARAAPDGHTILVSGTNTLTLNPLLQKKDANWFDPNNSFAPIDVPPAISSTSI